MAVKVLVPNKGLEYAMVDAHNDPNVSQFVGHFEGRTFNSSGYCVDSGWVEGSNHGWSMQAAVGAVQIYVRRIPR